MDEVWSFFQVCTDGFMKDKSYDSEIIHEKSESLRLWADDMRDKHIDRVSKGDFNPLSALTYSDMVVALRKIRAHAMNVAEAIAMYQED